MVTYIATSKMTCSLPFSQQEEVKMRVARQRIIHEELKRRELAGGEGFEPSQSEPESDVLPLDDPPT